MIQAMIRHSQMAASLASQAILSFSQLQQATAAANSISPTSSARLRRRMAAGGFTPVREAAPVRMARSFRIHSVTARNTAPHSASSRFSASDLMKYAAMPATA